MNKPLHELDVGDVIYGITPGGRRKMLLIYKSDPSILHVRHVPSMGRAKIGRDGHSTWCEGGGSCTVVSTKVLSKSTYNIVIGLDAKMRNAKELTDLKLSEDEIQLLLKQDEIFGYVPGPSR